MIDDTASPNKETIANIDERKHKGDNRTSTAQTGDRKQRKWVDLNKLWELRHLPSAKDAWPEDGSRSAMASDLRPKRPIDRDSGKYADETCRYCAFALKRRSDHNPYTCDHWHAFLASKPELREVLSDKAPPGSYPNRRPAQRT